MLQMIETGAGPGVPANSPSSTSRGRDVPVNISLIDLKVDDGNAEAGLRHRHRPDLQPDANARIGRRQ